MLLPKLSTGVRRSYHTGYSSRGITPSTAYTCTYQGECADGRIIGGAAMESSCLACKGTLQTDANDACVGSAVTSFTFEGCQQLP